MNSGFSLEAVCRPSRNGERAEDCSLYVYAPDEKAILHPGISSRNQRNYGDAPRWVRGYGLPILTLSARGSNRPPRNELDFANHAAYARRSASGDARMVLRTAEAFRESHVMVEANVDEKRVHLLGELATAQDCEQEQGELYIPSLALAAAMGLVPSDVSAGVASR